MYEPWSQRDPGEEGGVDFVQTRPKYGVGGESRVLPLGGCFTSWPAVGWRAKVLGRVQPAGVRMSDLLTDGGLSFGMRCLYLRPVAFGSDTCGRYGCFFLVFTFWLSLAAYRSLLVLKLLSRRPPVG